MRVLLIGLVVLLAGCTTTILDKHNEMMKSMPGHTHYATATPVYAGPNPTRDSLYRSACYHYENRPAYLRDSSKSFYQSFQRYGGSSQSQIENYVLADCEQKTNAKCVVQLYNQYERCAATFDSTYERIQATLVERKENEEKKIKEQEAKKAEQLQNTCLSFGIKTNTPQLSTCMMELYKTNAQIEAIRNASEMQTQAINAGTEEAARLRQFQQSMELLQQSNKLINPPQNKLNANCRYNTIMKTITCD
jgi:hypothetical protein